MVFDTICPWCYIGKHRLERALAQRPHLRPEIRWRAFLLNPEMPANGLERKIYWERKLGSGYRIQRFRDAVNASAAQENLVIDFDRITRMPSSINSHRFIQWAAESGRQSAIVEDLFSAYFRYGQDISEIHTLCMLAEKNKLSGQALEEYLSTTNGIAAIRAENLLVHRLGVSGVPCYIFNDQYAVSGAQEFDMLLRMIDIAQDAELEPSSR